MLHSQGVEVTTSTIPQWESPLNELLAAASPTSKVALVGIGHPLRGDDYVGSYVTKEIIKARGSTLPDCVYVFDAEDNVERSITRISRINPKHVIFIDACEMGLRPAETKLLRVDETSYPFFTTHGIPLKVLAEQLLMRCKVWVLAIQPKDTEFGEVLSPEVHDAADHVWKLIASSLAKEGRDIV
ncbi:MAG: hydrogenase maturation protease [Candidatus Bathyarchaeia archaeon]